MMNGMKNLFIVIIPLFLLGSLFAQREQPEVRTLDSKFSKSTKCLNPEYLLFSAKIKGEETCTFNLSAWSWWGGRRCRSIAGTGSSIA